MFNFFLFYIMVLCPILLNKMYILRMSNATMFLLSTVIRYIQQQWHAQHYNWMNTNNGGISTASTHRQTQIQREHLRMEQHNIKFTGDSFIIPDSLIQCFEQLLVRKSWISRRQLGIDHVHLFQYCVLILREKKH